MASDLSNLAKRVVVSAVFGPALLALFWYGGLPLLGGLMLVVALGSREFYRLQQFAGHRPFHLPGVVLSTGWCAAVYVYGTSHPEVLFVGVACCALGFGPWSANCKIHRPFATLRGVGYIGLLSSSALLVREQAGAGLAVLILVAIWATDTLAYFAGRRFGRRHPFPSLSPGKTDAGFVGGMAGAVAVCAIGSEFLHSLSLAQSVGLGLLVGSGSLAGDLAESKLKRNAGVKDASDLIPGHGGVMDRFDSFFFVYPLVYLYLLLPTVAPSP